MRANNRMKLTGRGHRFVHGPAPPTVFHHADESAPRPCNLCGALDDTHAITWRPAHLRAACLSLVLILPHAPLPLAAQGIAGHAFITPPSGSSEVLRGHTVHLLCASGNVSALAGQRTAGLETVGAKVFQVINPEPIPDPSHQQLAALSGTVSFAAIYLPRLINTFTDQFGPAILQSARTDFQGAYSFEGMAPGSYFVMSVYSTEAADVYWLVPVSVSGRQVALVDLGDFNLTDLRRLVRLDAVIRKRAWVRQMVATYVTNPTDQIAFANGELAATRKGLSEPIPTSLLSPAASCQ